MFKHAPFPLQSTPHCHVPASGVDLMPPCDDRLCVLTKKQLLVCPPGFWLFLHVITLHDHSMSYAASGSFIDLILHPRLPMRIYPTPSCLHLITPCCHAQVSVHNHRHTCLQLQHEGGRCIHHCLHSDQQPGLVCECEPYPGD